MNTKKCVKYNQIKSISKWYKDCLNKYRNI
jgi:hypothetical protein